MIINTYSTTEAKEIAKKLYTEGITTDELICRYCPLKGFEIFSKSTWERLQRLERIEEKIKEFLN